MTIEELKQSESNAFDLYFAAALQGLCSNPNKDVVAMRDTDLVVRAVTITDEAIELRAHAAEARDLRYEERPRGLPSEA